VIEAGQRAPEFEAPDQTGTVRKLTDLLADGPVVLFFYPAAMTSGCTAEACNFRDLAAEYAQAGAQRIGISRDAVGKQKKFADLHGFDYPLLSDPDSAVAESFGVKRKLPLGPLSTNDVQAMVAASGLDTDLSGSDRWHP